jgi:hypothetical protein
MPPFLTAPYLPNHLLWSTALLSLLLAAVCSSLVARVYAWTYQGLSWSPALVQSFTLASVVACMLMLAIGDNLAGAIGSMGFLAMIRFRTNLRDPRDMVFTFACLGLGVAAGMQAWLATVIGAVAFCLTAVVVHLTGVGTRRLHDGLLRFQADGDADAADLAAATLREHTRRFVLVTMREVAQGRMTDYSYQVKLRRGPESTRDLLRALEHVDGLHGITYMNQQATVEV